MQIDIFTRIMLAVIAGCLVLLTVQSLKPEPVKAAREEIIRVDICRIGGYHVSKWEILQIGQAKRR